MTALLQHKQVKRGLKTQYYGAKGEMAVIKCAVKGLDLSHVFDYWALLATKDRAFESTWLLHCMKSKGGDQISDE